jgi:Fe(3+) dicitrate transport protein
MYDQRRVSSTRVLAAVAALALLAGSAGPAASEEGSDAQVLRLPEEEVVGERPTEPFLPPVHGTSIYAGKKTTVTEVAELPKVVNENYRQLLYRTPGLLLSEETTPLLSIGYRGLEPHRAQFLQVLKDGIPIHADMFGYPEAYYTPPFDALERIEFIRGGGALLYGPQPGGALNFVTHRPPLDRPFSLRTSHTLGSDNFYGTYNAVAGTVDRIGYYAYYYQRQGDGFRDANSDFAQYSGSAKVLLDAGTDSRWTLNFDGYGEGHGEPGGLTRDGFQQDRNATTREFDRFRLQRFIPWLRWERDFSPETQLQLTTWGGYYSRFSKRQRGGGFGTPPSGEAAETNAIELQEFYSTGVEGRARHDWELWNETHTLTGGALYYRNASPRVDKRGATPDADDGAVRTEADRRTDYFSLFAEQRLVFGRLSITPGVRLENIWQSVRETTNVDKTAAGVPLSDVGEHDFEPLFGIGVAYEVRPAVEVYANVSSAYRPKIFTQAVSTSPTQVVAGDLEPGSSWLYEVGFRGEPAPWIYWDTSLFFLDFNNQIGTVSQPDGPNIIANVGRSQHMGWEAAAEVYLTDLYDALTAGDLAARAGRLSLYGTAMLLDAEFVRGPFDGNTPQYAPDHLIRAGVRYGWRDRFKAALLSTVVDRHFSDDNNNPERAIPSYNVWDLTFEGTVHPNVALHFGINNLFDENYFARVRSDGIDPAYRRNFYGGFRVYY